MHDPQAPESAVMRSDLARVSPEDRLDPADAPMNAACQQHAAGGGE